MKTKLKTEKIDVVYRQSELLNQFAKKLLMGMKGDIDFVGQLPKNANHKGVPPVIIENTHSTGECVGWLKDRILEVERNVGPQVEGLPTIAILVNHEDEVIPMAEALTNELEDHNIRAEACVGGKSLGEANDVRVFDVQHIKGLEFEAVFFVGVDVHATIHTNYPHSHVLGKAFDALNHLHNEFSGWNKNEDARCILRRILEVVKQG